MKSISTKILLISAVGFIQPSCVHKIRVKPRVNISDADLPYLSNHSSAQNMSSSVSLSSLAERVRKNNMQLKAATLKLSEAHGKVIQSGRLANPSLGVSVNKAAPGYDGQIEVSFSQRFPLTNKLSLERRVSKDALKIAAEEIKSAEQSLITAAQLIAVEVVQLRKQDANLSKQIASLSTVAEFIGDAASRGELSPLDATQTRLEMQTIEIKQKQIRSEQSVLTARLKKYIGLPASKPLTVTGNLPSSKVPSRALSLWNRADYRAKTMEAQYAKSNILLEKSKRYEDFDVSFSSGIGATEDAPDGTEAEANIGMGVSIPLPLYNRNEGNIHAASAKAHRNLLEKSALANEIKNQVSTYRKEMQTWLGQNSAIRG